MKLLVSCKDLSEARLLAKYDIDIIDIKNPREGSLGANYPWIIEEIRKEIKLKEISATIGDLDFKPGSYSLAACCLKLIGVDYIKAGLLVKREHAEIMAKNLRKATDGKRLVLASYADYKNISSVSPIDLINICYKYEVDGIMIDTFNKRGKCLFDFLSLEYLKEFVKRAKDCNLIVAIAGKLRMEHLELIKNLEPDVVGFRSAVCDTREGNISEEKLKILVEMFKSL